jgi:5'-3' exonuclease
MGVPGFFASLYKKYSNTKFVFSKLDIVVEKNISDYSSIDYDISSIDELFLDTNCLIHPVCFRVFNENQSLSITNPVKLEEKMIKEVILYIEEIINYINPSKLVYIAIDGVAPMAKIKHQRMRRFKSVIDNNIKEDIAKKHNIEYIRTWNNSAITPGTEFMEKLTKAIISYLNAKKQANISNTNKVKYIFSTANTPGEGEHKVLQYIRQNLDKNVARIIYGLDADLLYLSLASKASRVYLLREITEFQNIKSSDAFCFVSIDKMRDCVYETMIENMDFDNLIEYKTQFIQDYIFLGFLLGNDFLPCLPSVNLNINNKKLSGIDILMRVYKEVFEILNSGKSDGYQFIVNTNPIKISYTFLLEIFTLLSGEEEMYWRERYRYRRFVPQCEKNDAYHIELHRMENLMFKIPDLFELGKQGVELLESKKRYYSHYYNGDYNEIRKTIGEYFKGLYWNAYYYFDKCPDYTFYFKHHRLPFVSDIFEWMGLNKDLIESLQVYYPKQNDHSKLIHPIQQLFMVLPVQSSYLLPNIFKSIMTDKSMEEYFPRKIDQDLQLITRYWQALPEIKIIEPYFAWNKISKIKLTEKEENRNKFKNPYEIYI